MNGKIFKIVDVGYNKCYIRSTCESLSQRMARHRACYILYSKDTTKEPVMRSFLLYDEYGHENCEIELKERYGCDKEDLLRREGEHIKENECVNRCLTRRTRKDHATMYRQENSEKAKECQNNTI